MDRDNYERTHCSKCGEWLEIEEQEVCGPSDRQLEGILKITS